jgi:hypothetical protein
MSYSLSTFGRYSYAQWFSAFAASPHHAFCRLTKNFGKFCQ